MIHLGYVIRSNGRFLAEDAGSRLAMRRDDNGPFYVREYGNLFTPDFALAHVYESLFVADGRAGNMPVPGEVLSLCDNGGALVLADAAWSPERGSYHVHA